MNLIPHKYPFAIDDENKPIYIEDITQENKHNTHYHCFGCGAELFPVLGDVREHHFRHEKDAICNPDKYLHEYAKAAIKRRFEESEVFEIQYNVKQICNKSSECAFFEQFKWTECQKEEGLYTVNLKEFYDTCTAEKGYYQTLPNGKRRYIADLFLSNSKNPNIPATCIEVWVSHECTEEKKANGGRIIEIKILEEKDANRPLIECNDELLPIRFYNFQREVPFEATKKFSHIKLLPGLRGKVVVVDDSSCRENISYDPKASHEIILHEAVDPIVREVIYARYCNEHGFIFPDQAFCEYGKILKRPNGKIISCPYIRSEKKCPCSHFKYSQAKGDELKGLENLYWTNINE